MYENLIAEFVTHDIEGFRKELLVEAYKLFYNKCCDFENQFIDSVNEELKDSSNYDFEFCEIMNEKLKEFNKTIPYIDFFMDPVLTECGIGARLKEGKGYVELFLREA